MSWQIDPSTKAVTMHRGDTGAYFLTFTGSLGPYEDGDVACYKVKSGETEMFYKEYNLQPAEPNTYERGDGKILVAFLNSTTDQWPNGTYNTEFRVARKPVRNLKVAMVIESEAQTPITAVIDEATCLAYVTGDTGTVTLEYDDSSWSESPALYGITVTGTPAEGDTITVSWNRNADGRPVDGSNVRTVIKSTITINDVIIDI